MGKELLGVFCFMNKKGIIDMYLSQILGGLGEVLRALALKSSVNRLATTRAYGRSHSSPFIPVHHTFLEM